jgi:hypothetical protein
LTQKRGRLLAVGIRLKSAAAILRRHASKSAPCSPRAKAPARRSRPPLLCFCPRLWCSLSPVPAQRGYLRAAWRRHVGEFSRSGRVPALPTSASLNFQRMKSVELNRYAVAEALFKHCANDLGGISVLGRSYSNCAAHR